MYVIDLEGTQYPIQTTIKQDYELNGNQSLETLIKSNKVNDKFIKDISQMWSIVDFDGVEYKIIYFKRKGEGTKMTVDILSIPLFFHAFNKDRIYKEYNEHMTAEVAFRRIFEGTGYNFVIHGAFKAVEWEGFGAGEPRLATFKRALERYKAEFEIKGNTIHLKNLIGRDTQFQYRHRLNASDITQEVDAEGMWTYARGYGDYGDGDGGEDWNDAILEREYTSPLANIPGIGILHGPPIKNGKITDFETMDKNLKTLVDESIKVSVSASLHDLRKRGYKLAQPENGDRVFLVDERIEFDQEIRVVFMTVIKDWKGNILDLNVTFGGAGLTKRHQANIDTAIKNIEDVISGNKELPYNVLDEAVRRATESLKSAQTELIFDNGIIAQEKNDPNRFVLLNSKGLGISDDGGGTFKEAITADGFVLSAGAIGRLSANHIQIGPETDFEGNYDPSTKETPEQAQAKIDAMKETVDREIGEVITDLDEFDEYIEHAFKDGIIEEAEAKAIEKYINSLESEKGDVDSQYTEIYKNTHLEGAPKTNLLNAKVNYNGAHNELITAINDAIADGKTTAAEKANVDAKFLAYRSTLANLAKRFEQAIDKIAQGKADKAEENAKTHADGNDTVMRENLRLTSALPTSLTFNMNGITAYTIKADAYARLDHRGLYIKGGAIQIDGGLEDNQLKNSDKWNGKAEKSDVSDALESAEESITELEGVINTTFKDGVISEAEAKAIEKYINILNTEKKEVDKRYTSIYGNKDIPSSNKGILGLVKETYDSKHNDLITAINDAIADGKTTVSEKNNVDAKFLVYSDILSSLSSIFESAIDAIAQTKADKVEDIIDENKDNWDRASFLNADGTLNSSKLKGKLSDSQMESAKKWNNQGTYIGSDGLYTGVVVASQLISGTLDTDKIKVRGGTATDYTLINGSLFESRGKHTRSWRGRTATHDIRLRAENGYFRARNNNKGWSLYFSDWGISTYADGTGDDDASGYIEFHSPDYSPTNSESGLTIGSLSGRVAIETDYSRIYLNTNGASVRVSDLNDNYASIHASSFSQSSRSNLKRDIKDLQDNGLEVINSLQLREYKRLTQGEQTPMDHWQAGIILEEAPTQFMQDADSLDLYTMLTYAMKAIQELSQEINELKGAA